jgi:hypothetical protein
MSYYVIEPTETSPLIEYGTDQSTGIYLSINEEDYFHTASAGLGIKLSDAEMRDKLKRHGVREKKIDALYAELKSLQAEFGQLAEDYKCCVCIKDTERVCEVCNLTFYCSSTCQAEDLPKHQTTCKPGPPRPPRSAKKVVSRISKLPKEEACSKCFSSTNKTCAKCKSVFYCSRECQVSDWSLTHKFVCQPDPFPSKQDEMRDVGQYSVYGFLLAEKVQLVEIDVEEDEASSDLVNLKAFLGEDDLRQVVWTCNPVTGRQFPYALVMRYRTYRFQDGSNELACKLTNNSNAHDWQGPLVIMKQALNTQNGFESNKQRYLDIELKDLNDVIDNLKRSVAPSE